MSSAHTSTVGLAHRGDDKPRQLEHLTTTLPKSSETFLHACQQLSTFLSSPSTPAAHARRTRASDRLRNIGDKAWDTVFGVAEQSLQVALGSILRMARPHQAVDMSGTSLIINDVARVQELQASTGHDLIELCEKWKEVMEGWKIDGGTGIGGSGHTSDSHSACRTNDGATTAALAEGYHSLSRLRDTFAAFWKSIIPPSPNAIVNAAEVEQIISRLLAAFDPAEQNYLQGAKLLASLPDAPEPSPAEAFQARFSRVFERVTNLLPFGFAPVLKLFIGGALTLLLLLKGAVQSSAARERRMGGDK